MRINKYHLSFGALLFVTPLSAQQTVVVPDVNVEVQVQPTPFVNEITVMSDSAMIANLNENLRLLREEIAASECNTCGGANTTTKIAVGALIPVLVWIALELRGIKKNQGDDIHNEGDTNVEVTVEPHGHESTQPPDDDNDSGEGH